MKSGRIKPEQAVYLGVFLLPMAVYLATLCPTVATSDSGELVTAACVLGIPHPPGYPLWSIIAHLFTYLPISYLGCRVNLLTSVFAASAVLSVFVLLTYLLGRKNMPAAACASFLLAFSLEFWGQSVISKGLYAFNSLFFVITLYLLAMWRRTDRKNLLFLLCFIYGLSLTNHHTIALAGSVFAAYLAWTIRHNGWFRRLNAKDYLACVFFFAVALLFYLYLPVRALTHPAINWGDPETLSKMVHHITRQQYIGLDTTPFAFSLKWFETMTYFKSLCRQFTPWLAVLIPLGAWRLFRRDREWFWFTFAVFIAMSLVLAFLLDFTRDKLDIYISRVFFLPSYIIAALWIAEALSAVISWRYWLTLPVCMLSILPLTSHYALNDWSDNYIGRDYGLSLLRTVALNGVLFTGQNENTCCILLYLTKVHKYRHDIDVWDDNGYMMGEIYGQDFTHLDEDRRLRRLTHVQLNIINEGKRPVYFTLEQNLQNCKEVPSERTGFLFRVKNNRINPVSSEKELWKYYHFHNIANPSADLLVYDVVAHYHYFLAEELMDEGDKTGSLAELEKAWKYGANTPWAAGSIGSFYTRRGLIPEAGAQAAKLESAGLSSDSIHSALGLYFYGKNPERSMDEYRKAVEQNPDDPQTWLHLGLAYLDKHMFSDSLNCAVRSAAISPDNDDAWVLMGNSYYGMRNIPMAVKSFSRAMLLNSTNIRLHPFNVKRQK